MKSLFVLFTALILSASVSAQVQGRLSDAGKTPEQLVKEIKKHKSYLIDVRTPEEYREGHLQYSSNIDFKSAAFQEQVSKLDRNKPVYLYCRSGNRSGKATETFAALGFKKVYNIGSYELLKSDGLPDDVN